MRSVRAKRNALRGGVQLGRCASSSAPRSRQALRALFAVALACITLPALACTRTPPEPGISSAAPTTASVVAEPGWTSEGGPARATGGTATAAAMPAVVEAADTLKRCIRETPPTPPPFAPLLPAGRCPKDPEGDLPLPKVSLAFPETPRVKVEAELARAAHETERGLMYRTKMDEDKGMLFDLRERKEHAFWMHNTCMPLDMLFLDDDGTIVGILENVPTLNDEERTVGCPSTWVLEVVAGWSRRHGVRAGQRTTLPKR